MHARMLERINENAYKVELPEEYGAPGTFNVAERSFSDLTSRKAHYQESKIASPLIINKESLPSFTYLYF